MKRPLYLLDSYAFIYRSYFAFVNRPLRSPSGANVSAAFGFFRFLFSLFDERNPKAFAAVFDPKGKTFRHEMFPEYKATRQKTPEDLHAQVPLVEEILASLKIPLLRKEGWEADDLIATLARRAAKEGRECWIVSGDKDLLQLVGGSVKALRPDASFSYKAYGPEEVLAEWGLGPERILDYLSLTGDASDNIPGVAGIGDKTALKLLGEFRDIDDIYSHLDAVTSESLRRKLELGKESAYLSRKLVTLDESVPLDISNLDELSVDKLDRGAANPIFLREGMKSLIKKASGLGEAGTELFGSSITPGRGEENERRGGDRRTALGTEPSETDSATLELSPLPDIPAELLGAGSYEAVTTIERLTNWVDQCILARKYAFDCETNSLDELEAELVGFSLSCAPKKACYVPLRSPDSSCIPLHLAREQIKRLFSAPGTSLVGHNVKYDFHVLSRFGAPMLCPLGDTMIAAWLLDAEGPSFSLEALAERRLGYKGIQFDEVVPKGATFEMVPLERATKYAAEDADLTYRLDRLMEAELESAGLLGLYHDVEMPLLPILAGMEAEGILVEARSLREFGEELDHELDSIQREIWKLCGRDFNIASPKQLQEVLFIERKLPAGKKTKTGWSTDSSVLEELAALDPVPEKILRHRSLAKLKGTYVDALASLAEKEARVHTHFSQIGAATGRLSSRDPNLQNIPVREEEGRRIRAAFIAAPGHMLISADYSQIELVVLAHLSGDDGLLRAFREGVDVHRHTASLLFGIPETEVSAEQRRLAKTINFGVIYGMSAFRLANELKIPRGEAQKFIDAYFATYSGVQEFIRKTIEETEQRGWSSTILGRRRPILAINSRNRTEKQAAERIAVNTPIQGSAADIIKIAMIRVDRALRGEAPRAHLLLQVHDELIVEAPKDEADKVAMMVKREMEAAVALSLPLRVSVEIASRWGDMH